MLHILAKNTDDPDKRSRDVSNLIKRQTDVTGKKTKYTNKMER